MVYANIMKYFTWPNAEIYWQINIRGGSWTKRAQTIVNVVSVSCGEYWQSSGERQQWNNYHKQLKDNPVFAEPESFNYGQRSSYVDPKSLRSINGIWIFCARCIRCATNENVIQSQLWLSTLFRLVYGRLLLWCNVGIMPKKESHSRKTVITC